MPACLGGFWTRSVVQLIAARLSNSKPFEDCVQEGVAGCNAANALLALTLTRLEQQQAALGIILRKTRFPMYKLAT